MKKQSEYLKRRQDNPVTPTVKMVNFSHEQKQKDELSKALDKYRSTGSPKPSTSNVKSPPYALTKEQNDIELSPLFHILQVTKGKTADGSARTAQSSKGKNPVSKMGKLKSPDSSPRSSRSFQKLLANSPRSDSSRIKSNDTTTTKSLIVPKIGPPLEPRSKRKLRLAPESNPYKSFKLPFATQSHMATKDRGQLPSTSQSQALDSAKTAASGSAVTETGSSVPIDLAPIKIVNKKRPRKR